MDPESEVVHAAHLLLPAGKALTDQYDYDHDHDHYDDDHDHYDDDHYDDVGADKTVHGEIRDACMLVLPGRLASK